MAAIGLAQLKKINTLNKKRSNILKKYLLGIKNYKHIKPVYPYNLKDSFYWLFSLKSKYRDQLINFLEKNNISTAVHFVPLPLNKIYKKYKGSLKNTMKIWKEIFSLPFYPDLENKNINFTINRIKQFDRMIEKNENI